MPFLPNLEAMFAAGYEYVRAETCPECGLEVEVYLTPGKREILMEPMPGNDSPAVRHLEVCTPLPANKDELLKVGYTLAKRIPCPVCNRAIESYTHATRPELWLNPMMGGDWPVMHHRCNIAPKQGGKDGDKQLRRSEAYGAGGQGYSDGHRSSQDEGSQSGIADHDGNSGERPGRADVRGTECLPDSVQQETVQPSQTGDAAGIRLQGVRDPNYQLLAVGWQDGTLICQFKTARWSYEGVPEAEFHKLKRSPFAYRIFTLNIKGKFKGTKIG